MSRLCFRFRSEIVRVMIRSLRAGPPGHRCEVAQRPVRHGRRVHVLGEGQEPSIFADDWPTGTCSRLAAVDVRHAGMIGTGPRSDNQAHGHGSLSPTSVCAANLSNSVSLTSGGTSMATSKPRKERHVWRGFVVGLNRLTRTGSLRRSPLACRQKASRP